MNTLCRSGLAVGMGLLASVALATPPAQGVTIRLVDGNGSAAGIQPFDLGNGTYRYDYVFDFGLLDVSAFTDGTISTSELTGLPFGVNVNLGGPTTFSLGSAQNPLAGVLSTSVSNTLGSVFNNGTFSNGIATWTATSDLAVVGGLLGGSVGTFSILSNLGNVAQSDYNAGSVAGLGVLSGCQGSLVSAGVFTNTCSGSVLTPVPEPPVGPGLFALAAVAGAVALRRVRLAGVAGPR